MLKSGDYDPGKRSSTTARRTRNDYDYYSFEEFWDDIKRDHEAAGRAQEAHEQRENWERAYSSNISEPPKATSVEEECPVCGEALCKLFEPKKAAEKEGPARIASDRMWGDAEQEMPKTGPTSLPESENAFISSLTTGSSTGDAVQDEVIIATILAELLSELSEETIDQRGERMEVVRRLLRECVWRREEAEDLGERVGHTNESVDSATPDTNTANDNVHQRARPSASRSTERSMLRPSSATIRGEGKARSLKRRRGVSRSANPRDCAENS